MRESAGNTLADIGFDSNGDLDTTALLTHTGVASGYVHTWYDQSGNGNNAVQSTNANQPQIVSSGSVIVDGNGKATIQFDGSNDFLDTTLIPTYQSFFFAGVFEINTHYNYNTIFDNDYGINDWEYWFYSTGLSAMRTAANNTDDFRLDNSTAVNVNTQVLSVIDVTSTTASMYIDGSQLDTTSRNNIVTSPSYLNIAGGGGNTTLNGNFSEFLWYNSDQSSNRTGIEDNINDHYSIY